MNEKLVLCPLCGENKGYTLAEGSTYRWWSVQCAGCGQEVTEARADYPAETTPRTTRADDGWNEAGAYAQGLRIEIEWLNGQRRLLQSENEQLKARLAHSGVELQRAVAEERERCATALDHILREGGGTWGDWLRAGCSPPCCAGGPQWGHAWNCNKCPD